MRLAQEGGCDGGAKEDEEPGREYDQGPGQGDQADGILAKVEQRGQQTDAAGGLTAGALQFVVKYRILEGRQVHAGGVLHQPDADSIGKPVSEQAVAERDGAAQYVAEDGQSQ